MLDLPPLVHKYIYELVIESHLPAYLILDKDTHLTDWGGDIEAYGITGLLKGQLVTEQLWFLEGLLPADPSPLILPYVETQSGRMADVHIFSDDRGSWILFLDATLAEVHHRQVQQRANELLLLRDKQSRIMDQYLGKEIARKLAQGILSVNEGGERKDVTALFADIRGFTPFSEKTPAEVVFETLNQYLCAIIPPLLDETAILDKIIGDEVMAVFNILPPVESAPNHAVKAALRMLEAVKTVNEARRNNNEQMLDLGVGIATGTVALGVLGSKERKSISIIGSHVNLAARLQTFAGPRQIVIDENTFEQISRFRQMFSPTVLDLRGFDKPIKAFSSNPQ
jgi:class 3 adenylate cyclase